MWPYTSPHCLSRPRLLLLDDVFPLSFPVVLPPPILLQSLHYCLWHTGWAPVPLHQLSEPEDVLLAMEALTIQDLTSNTATAVMVLMMRSWLRTLTAHFEDFPWKELE